MTLPNVYFYTYFTLLRKSLKILFRTVLALLLLVLTLYALLHFSPVQTWAVSKVSTYLSEQLNSTVRIKRVDFRFYNRLALEEVYVADQNKDTLLYAGALSVKITDWFFLKDDITIHYVQLDDAVIKMKRTSATWNYQHIIDYFDMPQSKNNKKQLRIRPETIQLKNIQFTYNDQWVGQDMIASLNKGLIKIETIDYDKRQLLVKDIFLETPYFGLKDYTGFRPAITNSTITASTPTTDAAFNQSGWSLLFDAVQITNGRFTNDMGTAHSVIAGLFDEEHIDFNHITGSIKKASIVQDTLKASINLSAKERCGLELKKLKSQFRFTPKIMEFDELDLVTNKSHIGNYYAMNYSQFNEDMRNFIGSVILEGRIKHASVHSDDIAYFANELNAWKREFYIHGDASGTIEKFTAEDILIKSGATLINGSISMKGLPDIYSTFIDFKSKDFITTYKDIINFVPPVNKIAPEQLSKLGNLKFKGRFTGFLNDFVTYGTIQTDLGQVQADLNMKLPEKGVPSYSGKISTQQFALGRLLNNRQLGNIALEGHLSGSGFSLKELNAGFDGYVRQLSFNGYNYQNITVNGNLKQKRFTGKMSVSDPNLQLNDLEGSFNLSGKEIDFNMTADLGYANFKKLHIGTDSITLKGLFSLNFTGKNIDDFLGTARVYDAEISHRNKLLSFDSLNLTSFLEGNRKTLQLSSNEINGRISGQFKIMELPEAFQLFLNRYYPAYIKAPTSNFKNQDFEFNIETRQFSDYLQLIDERLSGLNESKFSGSLNLSASLLKVNATIPNFGFEDKTFNNIQLTGEGTGELLTADISLEEIHLPGNLNLPETRLKLYAHNDSSDINLITGSGLALNNAELNARIKTYTDGIQINFAPSSMILNDKKWYLEKGGELTIRKNKLDAKQISLTQGDQQITISTVPNAVTQEPQLVAQLKKVNIGDIAPLAFTTPTLSGNITGILTADNLFGEPILEFTGDAEQFSLDSTYIGSVHLKANANTSTGLVQFNSTAKEQDYNFNITGSYNYKDSSKNQLDIDLYAGRINLKILEPYLGDIFSSIEGTAISNLKLTGPQSHPILTGDAIIEEGAILVDYTQCKYKIKNGTIRFREDEIDFGKLNIKDTLNNGAVIGGKIHHRFFDDFVFEDVRAETEKLLLLNTTKLNNDQFYGQVTGSALMRINGPLTNLVMDITGQPSILDSSHIYLPTDDSRESNSVDYIEFVQFGSLLEDSTADDHSTNIVVNMNLHANEACKVDVILDEETGDVIKGKGNGLLNIKVGNKEPLSIRGKYEINSGEYTFNFNTFLKKPFVLRKGSIEWNGDPFQAKINIEAEYKAKNVDISSLSTSGEYKRKEDVTIICYLTGILLKPTLDFDFKLPEKSDASRDYLVVKKLDEFKNDQNEMYKQVASLLLFNSFIAPNQNFNAGGSTISLATSTIGGVISGWLTNVFNKELLKATNGILSTYIDINPTVDMQQTAQLQANVRAGLQILLSKRLVILFGGNYDYNNSTLTQVQSKGLLTPDISVEWLLNKDGSIRVVGFNRSSIDATAVQRNRSGVKLSYRKDFNILKDLFKPKK